MKILLVEDNLEKKEKIRDFIEESFAESGLEIVEAHTFSEANKCIYENAYDFIIVDLMLPRREGDDPIDISAFLVDCLRDSGMNFRAKKLAISEFDSILDDRRADFQRTGITHIAYRDEEVWQMAIKFLIDRIEAKIRTDFVIICAIEKEREAFRGVDRQLITLGDLSLIGGLDCREMTLGGLRGYCIKQPRMGLVDASITASRALSLLSPRLICMAGICGGIEGEVKLGQVLVSSLCWEHQAGKWSNDGFKIYHYQEPLDGITQTKISQLIEDDPKLKGLTGDLRVLDIHQDKLATLLPTVSGSAVIASDEKQVEIKKQHGKLAGLDMEVYGVYRAAALHDVPTLCFAAKTVVDLANGEKNDTLHTEGAMLSARFVAISIPRLLSK